MPMRMRRKPNLIPRMERCSRVLISDPEVQRGNWRALMPEAETVYLELGCGKGRFTAETAEQNPKALYIAVERVPDAMVIAMERVCAKELHNVFFVDGDAALLPQYFAPGEVSRIYINFCNPWDEKAKHHKRRLTHTRQLLSYKPLLAPGGEIWFKTDNDDLYLATRRYLTEAGFEIFFDTKDLHRENDPENLLTEHEVRFTQEGIPTKALRARLS